jgi:hypothetical protein
MDENETEDSPSSRRRDAVFALAIIAVAGLVLWEARKQPRSPYDPIGAAGVPIWTALAMIVLAGSMLVRIALGKSTMGEAKSLFTATEAIDDSYSTRPWLSAGAIALTLVYALVAPWIGFMAASVIFLAVLGWLLSDRTPRALAICAAIAVIAGIGLDRGFRALLIDLP